jgi:surface antigen
MKKTILTLALISTAALAACESTAGMGNKQMIGTGGGAVLGGLAGSQLGSGSGRLWMTGAGVLLGALAGSEIGGSLDKADVAYAQRATTQAYTAPIGQTIRWNNPDSGNYGTITPTRSGTDNGGRVCREYTQTIYVGGKQQSGYGTACQQTDGTWRVVS